MCLTGRPKLFFIQACRGLSTNQGVEVDDADDMNENDVQDEADELVRIPHEADTLVAYATTHGNFSNILGFEYVITVPSICPLTLIFLWLSLALFVIRLVW